jgi:hypothetical protein
VDGQAIIFHYSYQGTTARNLAEDFGNFDVRRSIPLVVGINLIHAVSELGGSVRTG